ncbi:flagellar hook-length control protein FliK [Hydrogenimonas sp.]|nr:flagellar hook-length control protein FliK [Hydrogenimonas sp.]
MTSLSPMPLLAKLEELDTVSGKLPASEKDPGLFKELLQLLQSDEADPKSLQSLLDKLGKNLEKGVLEDEKRDGTIRKDGFRNNPVPPLQIDIDEEKFTKNTPASGEAGNSVAKGTEKRVASEKLSSIIPRQVQDYQRSGEGANEISAEKRVRYAGIVSAALLERSDKEREAVHDFRSSKDIKELIGLAERHGLKPLNIELTVEKPDKKENVPKNSVPLPSSVILQQTEHISGSAAGVLERLNKAEKPRLALGGTEKEQKGGLPLRQLPGSNEDTDRVNKKPAAGIEGGDTDLIKLLSGLERMVSKKAPISGVTDEDRVNAATDQLRQRTSGQNEIEPEIDDRPELGGIEQKAKAAEALSQKIADAKVTVRHFAQSLREQVENYKPPFTRMQLSLDPKDLGSVEVTLVSRGNNLHIQVHSNPTAIGVMATQGNELKSQLVSMGFTDVQMQFNMNQQKQGQRQWQNSDSGYLKSEEVPDFYESLEIIIPQYV